METILNQIVDSRINNFLEIIHNKYPNKFKKENIEKEIIYIKKHILWEKKNFRRNKKNKKNKTNSDIITSGSNTTDTNKCSGRVWSEYILDKNTLKQLNDIDDKFKVDDFIDIDIKEFNSKYIIGSRCSKININNGKYCKLHSKHLIHGDYLELPDKELCFHFMKDGKYL